MKIREIIAIAGALFFIGFTSSCALKKEPLPNIDYYTIAYDIPKFDPRPTLPVSLSVDSFSVLPPYNTNRIIYSNNDYSQNRYVYHQWIARPHEMVIRLLARDLTDSQRFAAVLVPADTQADYQLHGTISEFYEQDTDTGWNAVISMTVTLVGKKNQDTPMPYRFQKNYRQVAALEHKNPKSLAKAMSMALSEISRQMVSDIYNAIQ